MNNSGQKAERKCVGRFLEVLHAISTVRLPGRRMRWISIGRSVSRYPLLPRPALAGAAKVCACLVAPCAKSAHVSGSTCLHAAACQCPTDV